MKALSRRTVAQGTLLIAALLTLSSANAQLDDILKHGASSGVSGNAATAAGAVTGHSIGAGSIGNITGLLQYCVKNNFLGGGEASSVVDKLTEKLGGNSAASADKDYQDGTQGIVKGANGKQLDLSSTGTSGSGSSGSGAGGSGAGGSGTSGDSTKADLAKQICDTVLSKGKALLK